MARLASIRRSRQYCFPPLGGAWESSLIDSKGTARHWNPFIAGYQRALKRVPPADIAIDLTVAGYQRNPP
jgi:hypothetical protein